MQPALVAELAELGCADPAVDCEVSDPATGEVLAIAEKWRPYRSLATSYLFSAAFDPAEARGNRITKDRRRD